MCQDEISQVLAVDRAIGQATVETRGEVLDISLLAVDENIAVEVGDWLVVYQGYALTTIDEDAAKELLQERAAAAVAGAHDRAPNGAER